MIVQAANGVLASAEYFDVLSVLKGLRNGAV